ncbi:hypothetical protein THASP1DRAFT_13942 [Thamnocephalis sphaerospora]|uniref:sn-1-specific diacylglycerol lipase n=1 Tax=Thamnocephalis sphaerospora TaxID=78915 RepID=A0A4P9XU07_9FUNG|nr:hypothetical protein THASP1DRAFT_13942 [Thamnocephalis sphaerospora]|eukprot:RKP09694.1 hypothetical protein THASP1DRAFT_13942 [Thamnocephalis sphaerospora]
MTAASATAATAAALEHASGPVLAAHHGSKATCHRSRHPYGKASHAASSSSLITTTASNGSSNSSGSRLRAQTSQISLAGSGFGDTNRPYGEHQPALLNKRVAGLVSSLSSATRLSLNCSAFLIECFFEGAKYGTRTGLKVSRLALVSAVATARDLHRRAIAEDASAGLARPLADDSFYQVLDKYTNLGIYYVHSAFSLTELFTMTGFYLTSWSISSGIRAADESVRIIDGLFGSTETSRALAAFVTLVKRELSAAHASNDPDTEKLASAGTMSMMGGILKALTAYACLQALAKRPERAVVPVSSSRFSRTFVRPPFPQMSLVHATQRYMHYASAAYGPSFLRLLGMARHQPLQHSDAHHHPNHAAFARHVGIPLRDIVHSSYMRSSGTPLFAMQPQIHPLVHYVCIDRVARAVVVTLRGTLGLSDVLTDLTCSYAEMRLHGQRYHTHSGMLESARLLGNANSEVTRQVRAALEREPTYGLIVCGHSLGGGVAALLSLFWSEPESDHNGPLPAGRPIRCFAYASPCVADSNLRKYAHGLVTTVVHGHDVVPALSLGVLHDFKAISVSLYAEHRLTEDIIARSRTMPTPTFDDKPKPDAANYDANSDWFWSLIKTLRADMTAPKLYPPGDVYIVDASCERYLAPGDTAASDCIRARMLHVRRVEERFGELVFDKRMFSDHSPNGYEQCLDALASKVPDGEPSAAENDANPHSGYSDTDMPSLRRNETVAYGSADAQKRTSGHPIQRPSRVMRATTLHTTGQSHNEEAEEEEEEEEIEAEGHPHIRRQATSPRVR